MENDAVVVGAAVIGACKLLFSLGFFRYGYYGLRFDADHLRTLTFAAVFFVSLCGPAVCNSTCATPPLKLGL